MNMEMMNLMLFGRNIVLPNQPETLGGSCAGDKQEEAIIDLVATEKSQKYSSDSDIDPKTPPSVSENGEKSQKTKLKKPDKILPCPRCSSLETKFCYYNNYNINQPRYFCKSCQRYWTAGGTMRSVPVGAGRRKSKISPSKCHHIEQNDTVLSFEDQGNGPPTGFVMQNFNGFSVAPPQLEGVHWTLPMIPIPVIFPQVYYNSLSSQAPIPQASTVTSPVLAPKALRINEASKSKMWTTLGMNQDSLNRKGFFEGLQPKNRQEKRKATVSPALLANPSALSRSIFFHENA